MLEYIRSLIAEILPQQPRQFRRRSLLAKREEAARRAPEDRPSGSFGTRGEKRPGDHKARR